MTWLLLVLAVIVVGFIVMYNRIVAMGKLTLNAWADVDVYLKQRAELVPNLVEAVKGASAYEQGTLERVVQARSNALAIQAPNAEKGAAEQALGTGLSKMVAVAENYPQLTANQNFLNLQSQLSDIEQKIASARQYYNACVRDFNTMIESFPQSLFAQSMGLKAKEFFQVDDLTERNAPSVSGVSG